jgi:hypothetical protein
VLEMSVVCVVLTRWCVVAVCAEGRQGARPRWRLDGAGSHGAGYCEHGWCLHCYCADLSVCGCCVCTGGTEAPTCLAAAGVGLAGAVLMEAAEGGVMVAA